MDTIYYVIADDTDCSMIGSAPTLKEAKKLITKDAAQYADPDCSMNYSIIKGERTRYNVTPYFKFNFEKEEEQNCSSKKPFEPLF